MKNLTSLLFTFSLLLFTFLAGAVTIDVTQSNFGSYRTLQNGNTYRFARDVSWEAMSCESAMEVADGANVVIEIAKGVTVNLTGGAANGMSGAGAGIEVPVGAKLTITGSGALYVNGGNAANGVTGGQGNGAVITDESYWYTTSGSGGKGGAGGGGAGAGIGGKGGNGGAGGEGAAGVTDNWKGSYKQSGTAGNPGGNGNQGQACGAVEICGAVTVIAKGGSAASRGGYGGDYSGREVAEGSTWYGTGYGGGGGGGGGGGVAASDIGGGGGGGGAGGGGGSGGICYFDDVDTVLMCKLNGEGGAGGKGVVGDVGFVNDYSGGFYTLFKDNLICPGEETSAKINTVPYSTYTPGAGGAGGEAGARGGDGSLNVELTASCGCGTRSAYNVGKISITEFIRWENDKLWRVKDGAYTEIAYETVQGWTGNFDGGKWYVVKGSVNRTDSINVGEGEVANLVLLDSAALTVDCGKNDKQTGIWVPSGRALNIFGVESGSLTAKGGYYAAGIGGGSEQSMGALTIYGGTVTATGGHWAAGIGGGDHGEGGVVTINGGTVTATSVDYGSGIGGGYGGAGGSVTINGGTVTASSISNSPKLGPRVFKIDDNHYREGICVSFRLPSNLRLVSTVDGNGSALQTSIQDGVVSVYASSLPRVTMTFDLAEPGYRFTGSNVISVGPFYSDETLPPDALPQVRSVALSFAIPDSLCLVSAVADNGTRVKTETVNGVTSVFSFPECLVTLSFTPRDVGYRRADSGTITVGPIDENATLDASELPKVGEDLFTGSVEYLLADGSASSASGARRIDQVASQQSILSSGWYMATNSLTVSTLEVLGTVNLILADGATLKVNGGIRVNEGNTLNIFCQREATGELVATGSEYCAGIGGGNGGAGGTVTINGGTVTATSGKYGAGIGGGYGGAGGCVTINGGSVTATSGDGGAGIGGGLSVLGGDGGVGGAVTINGGTVTATGGNDGAGIGGGGKGAGGAVTINGGTVTATGGNYGAGIGGGRFGAGGAVTINGGTVTATGGKNGAGIGGGLNGEGGTVTISGGSIKASSIQSQPKNVANAPVYCVTMPCTTLPCAVAGFDGYGTQDIVPIDGKIYFYLPNGEHEFSINGQWYDAYVQNGNATVTVLMTASFTLGEHIQSVGFSTDPAVKSGTALDDFTLRLPKGTKISLAVVCEYGYEYRGKTAWTVDAEGLNVELTTAEVVFENVAYCDAEGKEQKAENVTFIHLGTIGGGKWYAVTGEVAMATLTIDGTAHLILCDGAKLTVNGGIRVEETSALSIYGQSGGTGELVANGGDYGAGIGGRNPNSLDGVGNCGTVTINGGTVKATGGYDGAGIGGGRKGAGGSVTINGGTVTATSGDSGAGIGGGYIGTGGAVTINGGTVTATSVNYGSGIGGGYRGAGGCVTINGGSVTATGGDSGAGIGGGEFGAGGIVTIDGGTVTAMGNRHSAGIGGGYAGAGGTVTVSGGTVTATGGKYGAGIGGGYDGGYNVAGSNVTISGGTVTATGGENGAGIGGGYKGTGGTVAISGGSIKASSIQSQPKNAANDSVYCVTVPCTTSPCEITGLNGYGTKDILPIDGKVYLCLPNGTHVFTIDGVMYRADVKDAPTTAVVYTGPTCEGGEIAEGEGGEWIVTPTNGAASVTIAGLPDEAKLAVKVGDYAVSSAAFVGFGEDGKTFSLALDENGVVNGVPVKPTIGDLGGDATKPFTVGEGSAAVTVRTIPGLKYELWRAEGIGSGGFIETALPVGEPVVAEGASVTLTDGEPPKVKAFYKVVVSVP